MDHEPSLMRLLASLSQDATLAGVARDVKSKAMQRVDEAR